MENRKLILPLLAFFFGCEPCKHHTGSPEGESNVKVDQDLKLKPFEGKIIQKGYGTARVCGDKHGNAVIEENP